MTSDFEKALRHIVRDIKIDEGAGADLVAVGVQRDDCIELLEWLIEDEPVLTIEILAVMVQMCIAVGVWVERERWMST